MKKLSKAEMVKAEEKALQGPWSNFATLAEWRTQKAALAKVLLPVKHLVPGNNSRLQM